MAQRDEVVFVRDEGVEVARVIVPVDLGGAWLLEVLELGREVGPRLGIEGLVLVGLWSN